MKKILLVIFATIVLSSCICSKKERELGNDRIKIVANKIIIDAYIIEIDGHEYLYNARGGMIHLESCKCKEQENATRNIH